MCDAGLARPSPSSRLSNSIAISVRFFPTNATPATDRTKGNRKANLRFDIEAAAKGDLGNGHFAVVPGDTEKSEIVRRVATTSKALRMPPVYAGRDLTEREIELIRRWVEQGAKWQKHWSFIPPVRPETAERGETRLAAQSDRQLSSWRGWNARASRRRPKRIAPR